MSVTAGALAVRSSVRDYEIGFDRGGDWAGEIAGLERAFVIVDENVMRLHGQGVLRSLVGRPIALLKAVEDRKVFATVEELALSIASLNSKRNTVIVSIGGGITQDVTGFLASVLYRGLSWTYVPTTLLAMADSCMGGKTSLNLGSRKNLLGTMYPPHRTIIHSPFAATLPDGDFASGVGEIVKLHLMGDQASAEAIRTLLPDLMRRDPVAVETATRRSLEIKRGYVEQDEFDQGIRNMLNYGHCYGHALEAATDFAVPHGLAVVIGMRAADLLAVRRGLLAEAEAARRLAELYRPVMARWPALDDATRKRLIDAMAFDKKRTGSGLAVVVLGDGLRAERLEDVTPGEARDALDAMGFDTP